MQGEGFATMRMHPECRDYTKDWSDDDWEGFSEGGLDRPGATAALPGAFQCVPVLLPVGSNLG